MRVNYKKIRDEYIYCECSESLPSIKQLAAKHGVDARGVFDRSSKEKWVEQRQKHLDELSSGKKQNREPALLVSDLYNLTGRLEQEVTRRLRKPAELNILELEKVSRIAERLIRCLMILHKLNPEESAADYSKMSDEELQAEVKRLDGLLLVEDSSSDK